MENPFVETARTLREMRLARGWSCEELARKAGLSPEEIQAYEADPASLAPRAALQVLKVLSRQPEDWSSGGQPPGLPPLSVLDEIETRMLELEAARLIDQRRFEAALEQLDRGLNLHFARELTGRLLLIKAAALVELGRDERALKALQDAERRLERVKEPALRLRLRQEQMYLLCQAERYGEAEAWLAETRKLATRAGRDRERLLVRCLEGWIAAGSGRMEEALKILGPLHGELQSAGRTLEAAAIALDLAGLLTSQGNRAEVEELARQVEPLIQESSFSTAARTTLKVFCRSVHLGTLTPERSRKLAIELRKAGSHVPRPYELPG